MGTVTVYTAEHMKAIEDASVTSGSIDGSGHLQLTTKGGTIVDAGMTVGQPQTGYTTADANSFMKRDASGRSQVTTPSASSDIATKGYVDTEVTNNSTSDRAYTDAKTWPASSIVSGILDKDRIPGKTIQSFIQLILSADYTITGTAATVNAFTRTYDVKAGDQIRIDIFVNVSAASDITVLRLFEDGAENMGGQLMHQTGGRNTKAFSWLIDITVDDSSHTFTIQSQTYGSNVTMYSNFSKIIYTHLR
jgi:hypothetical protein